ncbi:MAG: DUF4123 domain-containing protein [Inhella sp.]
MASHAELTSAGRSFWIVDLASAPDALKTLPHQGRILCKSLLDGLAIQGGDGMAPWLIHPTDAGASKIVGQRMEGLAQRCPAVIGIQSALLFDDLFARLQRRLCAETEDGDRWLLRWYDPRVLGELAHAMDAQKRGDFLSCADIWTYWDRDGAERTLSASSSLGDCLAQPFVLPQPVWQHLLQVSEAGQVLYEYGQRWPEELQRHTASAAFGHAFCACKEAENLQMHSLRERLQLMALALNNDGLGGSEWPMKREQLRQAPGLLDSWVEALT